MQREIPKLCDLKEKIIILLLDASISSNLVKLESLDERRGNGTREYVEQVPRIPSCNYSMNLIGFNHVN